MDAHDIDGLRLHTQQQKPLDSERPQFVVRALCLRSPYFFLNEIKRIDCSAGIVVLAVIPAKAGIERLCVAQTA
jgi:hypothetical protein